VALVLACSGLVLAQVPAHACKCVDSSTQKSVQRADDVFVGTLVEATSDRVRGREVTTYAIEAETVYKGDLAIARVHVSSAGNSCGLGNLPTDRRYVWFATAEGGDLSSDQCSGTAKAADRLVERVETVLGKGEPLGDGAAPEEEQPPAEFTRVADADPEALTRLAAPGAALVLVGLLGLFVVRRRAG
jgi:hypothetical protein